MTKDFLNKVKTVNNVPEEIYLIAINVKSLYTNIPNSEGIEVGKRALDKKFNKTVAAKVITTFFALILTLNKFVFNFKHFLLGDIYIYIYI